MSGWTMRARCAAGVLLGASLAVPGCAGAPASAPAAGWLSPDPGRQQAQLERHLRGLDVAMMEVGQRYVDLHFAGEDANWELAAYELQKIRLALENALERRPKRAASARPFLGEALPALDAAVAARDEALFERRFDELTAACNACHVAEGTPFFEVHRPELRTSPLRRGSAPPGR